MKAKALTFFAAVLALSACSHGAVVPGAGSSLRNTQSIVQTGSFFEYTLPSYTYGVSHLAAVPSTNSLWFACSTKFTGLVNLAGTWFVCQMSTTGTVTEFGSMPPAFKPPSPYLLSGKQFSVGPIISNAGGYLWYSAEAVYSTSFCGSACTGGPTYRFFYLLRRVPGGAATIFTSVNGLKNAVLASNGNVWIPGGNAIYSMSPSSTAGPVQSAQLPQNWQAVWAACRYDPCSTADPYLYVLALYGGSTSSNAAVFKVSMTGQVVQTFNLPTGSNPRFMTPGPNGTLWITEDFSATGPNKVADLQPSTGTIAQFLVSSSNVGLGSIATGADGALWSTESGANTIVRITTLGSVSAYNIPTAASQPNGIIPCPSSVCGTGGGVWLAETAANKIARYDFPTTTALCTRQGYECGASFPHCCPGLVCVPFSTRAYCEPGVAARQFPRLSVRPGNVSVIDTAKKTITRTIAVGVGASALSITPDGRKIYVANALEHSITVLDTKLKAVVKRIDTGSASPTDVRIATNGLIAYATDDRAGTVALIDTAADSLSAVIPSDSRLLNIVAVNRCSGLVAGSPDGSIAYLLNAQPPPAAVETVKVALLAVK